MPRFEDLTGRKFGRLFVTHLDSLTKWGDRKWLCRCECGNEVTVSGGHLKSGHTKSCGCLALEVKTDKATRHGITRGGKPRTFVIWNGMKARCLNPKATSYPKYGARGISVCANWMSFENFHRWAMANGYADGLQIDRIDNDGDYEPGNCRFVSREVNLRNTSRNRVLTFDGKTMCASEWIRELGVSRSTFYKHLKDADGGAAFVAGRRAIA